MELRTLPPAAPRSAYDDYLTSKHWYEVRDRALDRAGHRCQMCNSADRLHVHHRTYERLGREDDADVIVLCHRCHQLFHAPDESGRPTRQVTSTRATWFFTIYRVELDSLVRNGDAYHCTIALCSCLGVQGTPPERSPLLSFDIKIKTHPNGTPWGGSEYRRWIEAFLKRPLQKNEQVSLDEFWWTSTDVVIEGAQDWIKIYPAREQDYQRIS